MLERQSVQAVSRFDPPVELWAESVAPQEMSNSVSAGFAQRAGLTRRVAVLAVDLQNYMVGPSGPGDRRTYPSSCGETGRRAIALCARLIAAARSAAVPVIYTKFVLRADGVDAGGYARKRTLLDVEGWALRDTHGSQVAESVRPLDSELVIEKTKSSAFFGTPLASHLIDRNVDTLVVIGGSTSNCVRATVVDAASLNFHVAVPAECVFDRLRSSHLVSLYDMDRLYADVLRTEDLIEWLTAPNNM